MARLTAAQNRTLSIANRNADIYEFLANYMKDEGIDIGVTTAAHELEIAETVYHTFKQLVLTK